MKPAKRLLLLSLTLISGLLCTSCLHPVQLHDRAVVQAVGIDWADDKIHMTFQIFSPSGDGSTISANADNAKIITTSGETVSDAVQNATLVQGKQLFVGHNRIIILGRALAERNLEQPLSYFTSNAFSRDNTYLMLADGTASDILSAKINQGTLPADTLEAIADNAAENGIVQNIQLYEFLNALQEEHAAAVLPVIRLKPQDSSDNQSPHSESEETLSEVSNVEMEGMAVFSGDKLVGLLDREQSRGLLWLRNVVERTVIVISTSTYETAALQVYHSRSRLSPIISYRDGAPHFSFQLEVHAKSRIGESILRKGKKDGNEAIDSLETAAEDVIRQECYAAFNQTTRTLRSDVLGLGDLVWKQDVETWKQVRSNWSALLPYTSLKIKVVMDIDRVGLEHQ